MSRNNEQDKFREKLAKWLGVTYEELEEYGEDVEANNEDLGDGEYGYFIQFSKATSQEILDKMDRIDKTNTVYFDLEELNIVK